MEQQKRRGAERIVSYYKKQKQKYGTKKGEEQRQILSYYRY